MDDNALAVHYRIFKDLGFDEILDDWRLVLEYPENETILTLRYRLVCSQGKIEGMTKLPLTIHPVEQTWKMANQLKQKLLFLRETRDAILESKSTGKD